MTPLEAAATVDTTMKRVTKTLDTATKAALTDAAKVARTELNATAVIVPGGDRRFSNMAKYNHGGRLAVTTRQKSAAGGREVWVIPRGPWKLAETGAAPHRVNHPGTRQGRRSWTLGQDATFQKLERTVPEDIGDKVEGAFRG